MFSNLPTMLQQQDFNASNRDMLEAARGGVTVDPNAVRLSVATMEWLRVHAWKESNALLQNAIEAGAKRSGAKIGAQLRIRLPKDYLVTDGPSLSLQDYAERISHRSCSESPIPPPSSRD